MGALASREVRIKVSDGDSVHSAAILILRWVGYPYGAWA